MANPTLSELMLAVHEALPKVKASQARRLIKDNNIRSLGKLAEVCEPLKEKTNEELVQLLGDPTEEEYPEMTASTKTASRTRSAKKAGSKGHSGAAKRTTAKKTARAPRGQARVVEAGVRGFRFGDVWNASVKAGEGVALRPANINKLYAQADELGISYDKRSEDAASIAKKIARKL